MSDVNWFAARCVYRFDFISEEDARPAFEERVVLLQAESFEQAVERAEREAKEYSSGGPEFTGLVQVFHLFEQPGDGAEVFSLIRPSRLSASDYIDRYFDSGEELQGEL